MHRTLFAMLLVLLLVACDQQALFDKFVPKEESALAKELIDKLAAEDFQAVDSRLESSLKSSDVREKLAQMANLMPPEAPKSVRVIGANTQITGAATTYNLTYEYEFSDRWVVASAVLERRDGQVSVQGIRFVPRAQSMAATNRFTFEGKGLAHYLVFAFVIAIPLFIVYALVLCARTELPKRKWLWLLFVAIGLGQFQFDWSTGAWGINPLSFALLGAGFAKAGPVAPYVFTFSLPLGAVLFLIKRHRMRGSARRLG